MEENLKYVLDKIKLHTKISLLAFLFVEISMKKSLRFGFGRQHQHISQHFLLLTCGDSFEEDKKDNQQFVY